MIKGGLETIRRFEPMLMMQGFGGSSELEHLVEGLGYEQYLFDDSGFYRARSNEVLNTILMTPRRAETVTRSTRNGK